MFLIENFVRDMSTLIRNSLNTISSDILYTIRWKTLVAIRQLDSKRRTLIFKCLNDIGFLDRYPQRSKRGPLDLTNANFDGLDLTSEPIEESRSLVFRGMSLINAKLDHSRLPKSDFSFTQLIGASFRYSILNKSSFYSVDLTNSSFIGATIQDCDFTNAILIGSDITIEQLSTVAFLDGAILPDRNKFIHYNLLYTSYFYPNNAVPVTILARPSLPDYNGWQWNITRDNVTDSPSSGEQNDQNERRFEASARHQFVMKNSLLHRIPDIYDKWINDSNNIKMRIKTQCGMYEEGSSVS